MSEREPRLTMAEGKYLRLVRRGRWEYAERTNATGVVAILAVTPAGEVVLVEQFRVPFDRAVIELPAGLVGDTEGADADDVLATARRELIEETGYDADAFRILTAGPTSGGLSTENMFIVRADGLRHVGVGGGVGHEVITVHPVPLDDVDSWLSKKMDEGVLVDAKVFAGLYFAQRAPLPRFADGG